MRFVTWNIENFWPTPGEYLRTGLDGEPSRIRIASDYDAIRAVIAQLGADVAGLQEMASPEAVRTLFPEGDWGLVFAKSFEEDLAADPGKLSDPARRDIYSAIVFRRTSAALVAEERILGLRIPEPKRDGAMGLTREGVAAKLRFGQRELWVASIHLKSHCAEVDDPFGFCDPADPETQTACRILAAQILILKSWLDAKLAAGEDVILLGDFNNQLMRPGNTVRVALDRDVPGGLSYVPSSFTTLCAAFRDEPRPSIDYIVISPGLRKGARLGNPTPKLNFISDKISDHCPVWLDIDFDKLA